MTVEDKHWEGEASDEEAAPVRERRLAQAAITELNREKEEQKVGSPRLQPKIVGRCWLVFCHRSRSQQSFWGVC